MQNEVFDKLYKINRKYKDVKISDVGCYELKYEDVKKISKKEMTKILFKSINDRVLLSRNSIYYDFEYFHSYIDLFIKLIIETTKIYNEDRTLMYVLSALFDYYENYQLTYWYALIECMCDNVEIQSEMYEYFEKIKFGIEETIKNHLYVYTEKLLDLEMFACDIQKQCELIKLTMKMLKNKVQMNFRLFREYDNRIKCINEIVYSLYALERDEINVDNLFMPLYGASLLAVYAMPVIKFFDIKKDIEVLYARIGFHDLLSLDLSIESIELNESKIAPNKYIRKLKKALKNKTTLIIDDNVGYGLTLNCCKKIFPPIKKYKSVPEAYYVPYPDAVYSDAVNYLIDMDKLIMDVRNEADNYVKRTFNSDEEAQYKIVHNKALKALDRYKEAGYECLLYREEPFMYSKDSITYKEHILVFRNGRINRKCDIYTYEA